MRTALRIFTNGWREKKIDRSSGVAVNCALIHVPRVKTGNAWDFVVSMAEVLLLVGVSALFGGWV